MRALMNIRAARTPGELEIARQLFREYGRTPDVGLCVKGFEEEIAGLPGAYSTILIALGADGRAMGCVALKAIEPPGTAEMKRLYIRAQYRGSGAGRRLVEEVIERARAAGFERLRLDTLPSMEAAQALYVSLGFEAIEPYLAEPTPGALCYELVIRK